MSPPLLRPTNSPSTFFSSEIAEKPLGRVICEKPMALFRTGSGRIAALEDRCAHCGDNR